MLSPSLTTVNSATGNPLPGSTSATATATATPARRRGLSYLRSLSSHGGSTSSGTETPRTSPRHFFTRSTSYQDSKAARVETRKRSNSRPDEPTTLTGQDSARSSQLLTQESSPTSTQDRLETGQPTSPSEQRNSGEGEDTMTRSRTSTRQGEEASNSDGAPASTIASGPAANGDGDSKQSLPTIRFYPHQDLRAARQSLNFSPISRTLPQEKSIIRVGRYSEREGPPNANPTHPSDAPVGFKSKVVSRKHCEFCFVDGQWQIKDVASSSGTFLNHIRLSQPNQESRLYPIKDGDIVQLGIDFRGGEEMIFRCVKIRIECNRTWQKKPNTFNKTRQAQLRYLAKGLSQDQPAANSNSGECSICLGNVLPCQPLFVAPCAHVWHYKCIRPLIEGKTSQYPHFQCPNCRACTDLEADFDVAESDMDEWMDDSGDRDPVLDIDQTDRGNGPEPANADSTVATNVSSAPPVLSPVVESPAASGADIPVTQQNLSASGLLARRQATSPDAQAVNGSIAMPQPANEEEMRNILAQQRTQTESPNAEQIIAGEGPLTPRNNAGPFVFDGSGSTSRLMVVPNVNISEISDG